MSYFVFILFYFVLFHFCNFVFVMNYKNDDTSGTPKPKNKPRREKKNVGR